MKNLETFSNWIGGLTSEFCARLDRNFQRVSVGESSIGVSINFTFRTNDTLNSVRVDTTTGNITIYLADTPTGNRRRTVTKTIAANVVIIDGNGATIYGPGGWAGGVSQVFLNGQWESLTFEPTGTSWIIVASVP